MAAAGVCRDGCRLAVRRRPVQGWAVLNKPSRYGLAVLCIPFVFSFSAEVGSSLLGIAVGAAAGGFRPCPRMLPLSWFLRATRGAARSGWAVRPAGAGGAAVLVRQAPQLEQRWEQAQRSQRLCGQRQRAHLGGPATDHRQPARNMGLIVRGAGASLATSRRNSAASRLSGPAHRAGSLGMRTTSG